MCYHHFERCLLYNEKSMSFNYLFILKSVHKLNAQKILIGKMVWINFVPKNIRNIASVKFNIFKRFLIYNTNVKLVNTWNVQIIKLYFQPIYEIFCEI